MDSSDVTSDDDPVTPAGRLFLRPEMNTIIHCAIGVKNRLDLDTVKSLVSDSLMVKHPRFCSLLVRDRNGVEHWRRTEIDIDRHIIVVDPTTKDTAENEGDHHLGCTLDKNDVAERIINEYLADLSVSTPLSADKPLWELHVLLNQNCAVFRIHHALGDGISLMSMLLANCRKAEDPTTMPSMMTGGRRVRGSVNGWMRVFLSFVKTLWLSFVFCLEFSLRGLWVRDRKTVISGGAGVELWPRKLATAKLLVEDMKVVKRAVANATINDVLFGVISSGLSRYLDHRSPNALQDGLRLTGVAMVNLREQQDLQDMTELMKNNSSSRWGNRFGILQLPVYYHNGGVDPLQYVKRAKKMIDRKKSSLEAHFSYSVGYLIMSLLGPKAASCLNYRVICNTSFTISNLVGPKEEITVGDNPVTFLRVNTSTIPHALTTHMVSYAGRADMQILVAKDIIPDPEFLAKCFEGALLEMKEAATASV
ncbi:hypothetical protein K2173_002476 [Erythroxylum novogranatense]|uniref:Diacylglycerol O-acyltransferase n=1 Tax=Erythroxylum novogranatense TaxID=1862640 RepID=A0AAV8TBU4_9ROSI|nr:hypothetical protein K2173_002476 [Erythroxylum novogranatense]